MRALLTIPPAVLLILIAGCAAPATRGPGGEPVPADDPATEPAAAAPAAADSPAAPVVDARYTEEMARLARDERVGAALRAVESLEPQTRADHIALNEVPAPPFQEDQRAAVYMGMLRDAGADTAYVDREGNVIAVRRGAGGEGTLVLSGHLDTVFPEGTDVTVETRGDTLVAPGIGDDTRGLMVVLTVLRAMEAADLRTQDDVWFVGTVGEEGLGDLRGVKHLFRAGGPRIDAFISVDGGGDRRITHQALGSRRYRTTFRGPGGHSWGAFGTANPAHAMGRAVRMFDERAADYVAEGPRTSYNVGVIGGGTSVNSIPFEAWMEVDMRSLSEDRLQGIDALFRATMEEALTAQNALARRGDALTLDLDLVGDRPSGEVSTSEPLVQRAMAAVESFGLEPSLGRSSTDSNIPIAAGVPAVTIGGGGAGGGAHSLDEWWLNEDGHVAIQRTLLLVLAQAGLAP